VACRPGLARGAQPVRAAVGSSLPTAAHLTNNETSTRSFTQKNGQYQ
jgi:hypothetical protein